MNSCVDPDLKMDFCFGSRSVKTVFIESVPNTCTCSLLYTCNNITNYHSSAPYHNVYHYARQQLSIALCITVL